MKRLSNCLSVITGAPICTCITGCQVYEMIPQTPQMLLSEAGRCQYINPDTLVCTKYIPLLKEELAQAYHNHDHSKLCAVAECCKLFQEV